MQKTTLAAIEFSLDWQSLYASHRDRHFVDKIHFWRDIFPGNLNAKVESLQPGESYRQQFDQGTLVDPFDQKRIQSFRQNQIHNGNHENVLSQVGRYYPQGWAWKALNCFPQTITPFRLIDIHKELVVADTNHPLSRYPLTLEARLVDKWQPTKERGGGCNDIASIVTEGGPGMQIPHQWAGKEGYATYPFSRTNEADDAIFYHSPRMVQHLDSTAVEQVKSIYSQLVSPGSKVLDLMSSCTSHLPQSHDSCELTGLGLNQKELQANQQLNKNVVHDLNQEPTLPFVNNAFDAVICTASIEYLTQPLEVLDEIARVTRPGGVFVATFSDRWFPGKEIEPWSDLHPFERLGLILDYYVKTKKFENLHTESILGLPRPLTDRHINKTHLSDPIFAVWGSVKWP